ncbi:MAG: DUF948 domain-containing protein [Atopobiaceae bacterium]|nr:DUF948 domain-containing protein [Atopobiaceae bacterium]
MDMSQIIPVALLVLAIAGVWAVVELALTIRSTRRVVNKLGDQVNETLTEVTPIISKLDGVVDSLDPALKQVDPLMQKLGMTVDALTVDLMRVDEVMANVSAITGSVSRSTASAAKAGAGVANRAEDAENRLTGRKSDDPAPAKLEAPASSASAPSASEAPKSGYFTYPSNNAKSAPAPEPEPAAPAMDEELAAWLDIDPADADPLADVPDEVASNPEVEPAAPQVKAPETPKVEGVDSEWVDVSGETGTEATGE